MSGVIRFHGKSSQWQLKAFRGVKRRKLVVVGYFDTQEEAEQAAAQPPRSRGRRRK